MKYCHFGVSQVNYSDSEHDVRSNVACDCYIADKACSVQNTVILMRKRFVACDCYIADKACSVQNTVISMRKRLNVHYNGDNHIQGCIWVAI